ncbi:hypothetical protein [Natronogracilivirga saccharolytica]|uniref:Uncharacterized protein n=1 Tax=Natronogracilivirga saccharolytica TaxID=2812953 RepID=A0A8J7S6I6_9BACT|nr:hypothetical protein [Natronogracilivirga saccharolytica]MBP3192853.1 hypothetical protein [Natronogracilivirga saccharolytica]
MFNSILITPLEALVAIVAIIAVFGLSGYIILKIIQLIAEAIRSRRQVHTGGDLIQRLEQYELRQEQLLKRIQNLETIIVDADLGNPRLKSRQSEDQITEGQKEAPDRPLKNKLRK